METRNKELTRIYMFRRRHLREEYMVEVNEDIGNDVFLVWLKLFLIKHNERHWSTEKAQVRK